MYWIVWARRLSNAHLTSKMYSNRKRAINNDHQSRLLYLGAKGRQNRPCGAIGAKNPAACYRTLDLSGLHLPKMEFFFAFLGEILILIKSPRPGTNPDRSTTDSLLRGSALLSVPIECVLYVECVFFTHSTLALACGVAPSMNR